MYRLLLFLTVAFLAQMTHPTAAAKKNKNVCEYIEIASKGGISTRYPSYLGVFQKKGSINGKLVYEKSDGKALWWSTEADSWKIGHKKYKGTNIGNVYNSKEICEGSVVDLFSDKCGPWWKYWTEAEQDGEMEWESDMHVKIKCFDLYYQKSNDKYCAFPEDSDGIQIYLQDVTRYDDLGPVTRACDADEACTEFYFSKIEQAYFICPTGTEIREEKGYVVYHKG